MSSQDLDGRGFIFDFFHYLWLSDPLNLGRKLQVNIPDTIFYKYGKPRLWYFSDKQGEVKRKTKEKLVPSKIMEAFIEKQPKCKIIARFIHMDISGNSQDDKQQKIKLEYFDEQSFKKFMKFTDFDREGYLQLFIQPKGDYNSQIKIFWGSDITYFQQYESNIPINDTKYDIYQRAILNESCRSNTVEKQISGKLLPAKIETLCNNISTHVHNITNFRLKIIHLEVIFKIDSQNNLYLLSCEAAKTNSQITQQLKNKTREVQLPQEVDPKILPLFVPKKVNDSLICPQCKKMTEKLSTNTLTFQMIIDSWKIDHLQNNLEQGKNHEDENYEQNSEQNSLFEGYNNNRQQQYKKQSLISQQQQTSKILKVKQDYQIPKIIKEHFPKMQAKDLYKSNLKTDFTENSIQVCETCYLEVVDSLHKTLKIEQLIKYYKNKQKVQPHSIYSPQKISYKMLQNKMEKQQNQKNKKQNQKFQNYDLQKINIYQFKQQQFQNQSYNFDNIDENYYNNGRINVKIPLQEEDNNNNNNNLQIQRKISQNSLISENSDSFVNLNKKNTSSTTKKIIQNFHNSQRKLQKLKPYNQFTPILQKDKKNSSFDNDEDALNNQLTNNTNRYQQYSQQEYDLSSRPIKTDTSDTRLTQKTTIDMGESLNNFNRRQYIVKSSQSQSRQKLKKNYLSSTNSNFYNNNKNRNQNYNYNITTIKKNNFYQQGSNSKTDRAYSCNNNKLQDQDFLYSNQMTRELVDKYLEMKNQQNSHKESQDGVYNDFVNNNRNQIDTIHIVKQQNTIPNNNKNYQIPVKNMNFYKLGRQNFEQKQKINQQQKNNNNKIIKNTRSQTYIQHKEWVN